MCLNSEINYTAIDLTLYDNANISLLKCEDCTNQQTIEESVICLTCGILTCRNHISKHYQQETNHSLIGYLKESNERFHCLSCNSNIDIISNNNDYSNNNKIKLLNDINDLFNAFTMLYECSSTRIDNNAIVKLKESTLKGIADYINSDICKNIIVLTGAGISVAANIPDFRSPKTGLYHNISHFKLPYHEAIFDIDYLKIHPEPFFSLSKVLYPSESHPFIPTDVHHFIKLLDDKGLLLRNYTQNIDTLERIVGIDENKLIEAHGSLHNDAICLKCSTKYSPEFIKEHVNKDQVPRCTKPSCDGIVKPDIVFWGDPLPTIFNQNLLNDFKKSDLLIVIGTSLKVNPIASIINLVPKNTPRLLINLEEVGVVLDNEKKINFTGKSGFNFNHHSNDVKWLGDCQKGVKELKDLLQW